MQITLSDSVEGLQDLLDAYNAAAKRFGLKINAGKTEVLWVFYIDEVPLQNFDRTSVPSNNVTSVP